MTITDNINLLFAIAGVTGLLSVYYLLSLLSKIKKLNLIGAIGRLVSLTFLASISASLSFFFAGTQGYQGLTREEPAATIKLMATGEQSFNLQLVFPDGTSRFFSLKGDEFLIDANILKWKPWTNVMGLHTAYRLDRISGRYHQAEDEINQPRTLFEINDNSQQGLGKWREQYRFLSFLLDVEHGSASFVDANPDFEYQLMVTNDGLLIRKIAL